MDSPEPRVVVTKSHTWLIQLVLPVKHHSHAVVKASVSSLVFIMLFFVLVPIPYQPRLDARHRILFARRLKTPLANVLAFLAVLRFLQHALESHYSNLALWSSSSF